MTGIAIVPSSPWRVLVVASAAQFGISVVDQGIPTLGAFIKTGAGLSAAAMGVVIAAFPLGKVLGSYAAGRASDAVGERSVLLVGGVLTAFLVALSALLPRSPMILLLVCAGAAGATASPAGGRMVLNAFPRNRRGVALGLRQTAIPLAGGFAAFVLPAVAAVQSWRLALVVAGAVTLFALAPLSRLRTAGSSSAKRASEPAPSAASGVHRDVALLTVWGCLLISGQYATLAFLALDVHQRIGLPLATASLLLVAMNVAGVLARVGWGALSDRLVASGRKPLLLATNCASLAAALLLYVMPGRSLFALSVIVTIVGLSLIGFQGLWMTMLVEAAGPERVGAATGFAISFVTLAIAAAAPTYGLVADLAGSYRAVWAVLAASICVAFVPASLLRESGLPEVAPAA